MKPTQEAIGSSQAVQVEQPTVAQPLEQEIRYLTRCCHEMIHHYYETEAPWSGPTWWLTFNQTGIRLREALEEVRRHPQKCLLSDQVLERTYLLLIRVAYFFEPDGPAEVMFREQEWVQQEASPR